MGLIRPILISVLCPLSSDFLTKKDRSHLVGGSGTYDDNGDVEFYAFLSSAATGVALSPANGLGRPRLSRI
jgi:hypothetical protein